MFDMARTSLSLGPLALNFILDQKRAGYFPARLVKQHIDNGSLYMVQDAPIFPFPAYVIGNAEKNPDLMRRALDHLHRVATVVDDEQDDVLEDAGTDTDEARTSL